MKTDRWTVQEKKVDTVAAIDIGANSIRMVIAEILPDGQIEILEKLQRSVRLGQDTFRRGRIRGQTMRAAVGVLRDYKKRIEFYHVQHIRAVATSAVREASNADTVLDRILMATGLTVQVIDTSEESRITVSAFLEAAGKVPGRRQSNILIAEAGGGSTLLTLLQKGEINTSQSLPLGSIRLQEALSTRNEAPERAMEIIRQQISNVVSSTLSTLPLKKIKRFVAIGGDARFVGRQIGKPTDSENLSTIGRKDFEQLLKICQQHNVTDLAKKYGLSFADAETLNPSLLVYQALWNATSAEIMMISQVTMRDGLLIDLAGDVTGREDRTLLKGILHSAEQLAEKYRSDSKHAHNVASLALGLFDELKSEHGLDRRYRILLNVAGLTHEIGKYVSNRAHHKHSQYLIANSEIFGLTHEEIRLIAHIARYHRRSSPKPSHADYMALSREERVVVSKLAALLRVADALDTTHSQPVDHLRCEQKNEELIIYVPGVADLNLERRAIAVKGDLFEDIFGLKIRLEEEA